MDYKEKLCDGCGAVIDPELILQVKRCRNCPLLFCNVQCAVNAGYFKPGWYNVMTGQEWFCSRRCAQAIYHDYDPTGPFHYDD
jgi:hypothetical protein